MRGTRWLLLVVIVAIVGGVAATYRSQKVALKHAELAPPEPLPDGLKMRNEKFTFERNEKGRPCPRYGILADDYRQLADASRVDMAGVSLKLYNKGCTAYTSVSTASAQFFPNDNRFFAAGAVEITLDVPLEGRPKPKHQLVSIKTSGVTLNTSTARADTDQLATFTFENGDGQAVGASYDPDTHDLELKTSVLLHRHPPGVKPMTVEAGHLLYHQSTGEVLLSSWGRLMRDDMTVEGENPVIKLRNREFLESVHATKAHGVETQPTRKLQYAADDLLMDFDDHGEVSKITGQTNAKLEQFTAAAETVVTANHVEMNFVVEKVGEKKESLLSRVAATGQGVVTSRPLLQPLGETHVLRSDNLEMRMRPGGKEIETVAARAPGVLEFQPNLPTQRRRVLNGNNMLIAYGAQNRIESFRTTDSKTETYPNDEDKKRNRTVSRTSSRELSARFESKSNKLAAMDQKGDFTYDEGDRHARAAHATLDSEQNVINLEGGSRMWDLTGSTTADRIRLDERTGDFVADINVNSTRMPDHDSKKTNSQMLNGDDPMQASANHMESTNKNKNIRYVGNAQMWQGANRLTADRIDLDRDKKGLIANGNVVSSFWETPKVEPTPALKGAPAPKEAAAATPPAQAVQTIVRAPRMVYTDADRLAFYSGGVTLSRPNLREKSTELRAYLAESGAESRLDKAFADGGAEIVQTHLDHTRTGTAEHCEYLVGDGKVVLRGGKPKLVDTTNNVVRGSMEGPELTYLTSDGSLLGTGAAGQMVQSRIFNKAKK